MHDNYGISWDTHDVNTLAVIVEPLILLGVTYFILLFINWWGVELKQMRLK